MSVESHQRYADDLGAYLLDALSADETAAFESHLAECADCRQEVDRLRAAADALPRSVEPFAPPASLKRSLMQQVRAEAGEGAARTPLLERLGLAGLFSGGQARLALGAAAAVLLVAGFGIGELASSGGGGSSKRTVAAVVDKSRVPTAGASLTIRDGTADLHVSGLPSPGAGNVYEVWLKRGNQIEPSSLFSVSSNGTGAAAIPGSLDGVDAVMVTSEKGPTGTMAPTSKPIIVAAT